MNTGIKIINDGGVVNTFGDFIETNLDLTNKNGGRSNHLDYETTQDLIRRSQHALLKGTPQTKYLDTQY